MILNDTWLGLYVAYKLQICMLYLYYILKGSLVHLYFHMYLNHSLIYWNLNVFNIFIHHESLHKFYLLGISNILLLKEPHNQLEHTQLVDMNES